MENIYYPFESEMKEKRMLSKVASGKLVQNFVLHNRQNKIISFVLFSRGSKIIQSESFLQLKSAKH